MKKKNATASPNAFDDKIVARGTGGGGGERALHLTKSPNNVFPILTLQPIKPLFTNILVNFLGKMCVSKVLMDMKLEIVL